MKYSVAIIEPVGGHGGMDYYDLSLCEGIQKAGGSPVLITSDYMNMSRKFQFPILPYFKKVFSEPTTFQKILKHVGYLIKSIGFVKSEKINVVHFHFFQFTLLEFFNLTISFLARLTIVATVHDVESFNSKDNRFLKRMIFLYLTKIIVHNQTSLNSIIDYDSRLGRKCEIIHHGNFINQIKKLPCNESREYLELDPEIPVLLFFGQIKKVKGLEILLRAMTLLKKQDTQVLLLIAGKVWKDDFQKYEKYIHENELGEWIVKHIRYIPNDQVDYYYNACDMVVLPYKKIYQSAVLLMAMSYNKPVLVSNIGGMTEIISDGINGYTFEAGNEIDLADKIQLIISNSVNSRVIAEQGFQYIMDNYDWDVAGRKTLKLYQSMVEG
ncbi:MAG: glycosyltransferase family 4 protein [Candidatus Marinimicrobia bacterium]|jgi:glycosyltransferase involved in cell wall biosynthesis|nr:glycosyltransferase family 4 protein [Candidatus Neomarinimicrobiota bacterium]MBT4731617.1 glycosyltransferase family 4 protein [Candidatus Woesearchaeota archaeon]MBT3760753.1 glycosyltransferase family 4 protein [Candidatus Neomarinimicrobiota bacterium]MBT3896003.1 glycosyltransferase family 4 protein [Candidatus Neomarinimicrobiota bacterium]MBT4852954.1 glycosyltransferase family 4 protein [Candidatus Neomarinimicrobiota bacterium]